MYQYADSLPKGKEDENFVKKPDIALKLINQTIERKYRPGITEIDYLITNEEDDKVTGEWMVKTFSQRNYIEKFYREACMMVRLKRISNEKEKKSNSPFHFSPLFVSN